MKENYEANMRIFKAFCDINRLKIIDILRTGEKCACDLIEETSMTQSALSYHMKILCESGIVQGRQQGKWTHYNINQENSIKASELLIKITEKN